MSVDLSDLNPSLQREVGLDDSSSITDTDLTGYLSDAFWTAVLDGIISGYSENDGTISPVVSGATDLPRELQQLLVIYAAYIIIRNQIRDLKTFLSAKAGPVSFETQQSAVVLKEVLTELYNRKMQILNNLTQQGHAPAIYVDMVRAREEALWYGDSQFLSGSTYRTYG